jgi:putative salt-induced outer membrane protein YdiY
MNPARISLLVWLVASSAAGEPASAPPRPPLNVKLGVSYVATAGNTETSTTGFSASLARDGERWAIEGSAASLRSSQKGRLKAERHQANVRVRRKLKNRFLRWAAGFAAERNRFAGVDLRTVADSSLSFTFAEGPDRRLETLAGLTLTREERAGGEVDDAVGALIGARGGMKLSSSADIAADLSYFPNLEDLDDNRFTAKLTLGAALNRYLGLELGYDWRYDNTPVPGFGKTDSTATTSVIVRMGRKP